MDFLPIIERALLIPLTGAAILACAVAISRWLKQ